MKKSKMWIIILLCALVAMAALIVAGSMSQDSGNYQIRYHGNGGSFDGQDIVDSKDTIVTDGIFTRDGYTFKIWNTKSDHTGTYYAKGQEVTGKTDLYAIWGHKFDITKLSGSYQLSSQLVDIGLTTPMYMSGVHVDNEFGWYITGTAGYTTTIEDGKYIFSGTDRDIEVKIVNSGLTATFDTYNSMCGLKFNTSADVQIEVKIIN